MLASLGAQLSYFNQAFSAVISNSEPFKSFLKIGISITEWVAIYFLEFCLLKSIHKTLCRSSHSSPVITKAVSYILILVITQFLKAKWERAHRLVGQSQTECPENIHTSNIMWTQQAMFRISVHTYMHAIIISFLKGHENGGGWGRAINNGLEGRRGRRTVIILL